MKCLTKLAKNNYSDARMFGHCTHMKPKLNHQYRHLDAPLNTPVRFNHEHCGDTRQRLYVTRTFRKGKEGWLFHCHNCAPFFSGFNYRDKDASPKQTVEGIKSAMTGAEKEGRSSKPASLPVDRSPVLSNEARRWLQSYGLTNKEISMAGFSYSPNMDRLVMPVRDKSGSILYGWQARRLGEDTTKPKYITRYVDAKFMDKPLLYWVTNSNSKYVVIVEDIVSAIKCGRHHNAIAILGSHFPDDMFITVREFDHTFIWLDEDKRDESLKYHQRLSALGVKCRVISTKDDPKDQADEVIARRLSVS